MAASMPTMVGGPSNYSNYASGYQGQPAQGMYGGAEPAAGYGAMPTQVNGLGSPSYGSMYGGGAAMPTQVGGTGMGGGYGGYGGAGTANMGTQVGGLGGAYGQPPADPYQSQAAYGTQPLGGGYGAMATQQVGGSYAPEYGSMYNQPAYGGGASPAAAMGTCCNGVGQYGAPPMTMPLTGGMAPGGYGQQPPPQMNGSMPAQAGGYGSEYGYSAGTVGNFGANPYLADQGQSGYGAQAGYGGGQQQGAPGGFSAPTYQPGAGHYQQAGQGRYPGQPGQPGVHGQPGQGTGKRRRRGGWCC